MKAPESVARRGSAGPGTDASRRREDAMLRRHFHSRSPELREQLIERFLPLARSLAMRYSGRAEPTEDLVQVASLGLVKALDRFDPGRGSPFVAFATPTILGELRRHFRDRVWAVRLPRGLQELAMSVEAAEVELAGELGRRPSVAEIADHTARSIEDVLDALEGVHARRSRSLDAPVSTEDGEKAALVETISAIDPGYDRVEAQQAASTVGLTDRDHSILRMRFVDELTQSEIGERFGISQMQVSRLSRATLRRLLAAVKGDPVPAR